ncbi:hypothetical protein ACE6H2_027653 [Prunus campanulata]
MARISKLMRADSRINDVRLRLRQATRDVRHCAQNMRNHVGLTITRDIEIEAAIEFKKSRIERRPIKFWVCADNPEDNRRMKECSSARTSGPLNFRRPSHFYIIWPLESKCY